MLLQPSKPPATSTRRSSKAATAQPERPTAMVGPEEKVMLVASKILRWINLAINVGSNVGPKLKCSSLFCTIKFKLVVNNIFWQRLCDHLCQKESFLRIIWCVILLTGWDAISFNSAVSAAVIKAVPSICAQRLRAQMICGAIEATEDDQSPGGHQQRAPRGGAWQRGGRWNG